MFKRIIKFIKRLWQKWYEFIDKHLLTPPKDEDLEWYETNLKIPAGETQVVFDITGLYAWEWKSEIILLQKEVEALPVKQKEKLLATTRIS